MTGAILLLLLVAFIASRLFRSTKMWWTLMSTIMAGLLVGMLSKEALDTSSDDDSNAITQVIGTIATENCGEMQSLASTVTEGNAVAFQGLQVIDACSQNVVNEPIQYQSNQRASPEIENDS